MRRAIARRTLLVVEASARDRLPSDLAGIAVALFDGVQRNVRAAVGPAVSQLKEVIDKLGTRAAAQLGGERGESP